MSPSLYLNVTAGLAAGCSGVTLAMVITPVCRGAGFELTVGEDRLLVPAGFDEGELRKLLSVVWSLR